MLTKATKAEILDLYDGSFASIKELSMLFKVHHTEIMYFLNYKDFKKKHIKLVRNWQKRNPEKFKRICKKASNKWRMKNIERVRAYCRAYSARPEVKHKAHQQYIIRKHLKKEEELLSQRRKERCLICGQPFEETEDSITKKKTGHTFKPTCNCHPKGIRIS
ncbi:hypothetical protein LCGC14_2658310, partial [marine sediment metagenome]